MADGSYFEIFLIFCCFSHILQAAGNVVELDESFKELKNKGFWFVEFYAPWCGHCQKLEPIWQEVGVELKKSSPIVTAKLDCTKFRAIAEEMGIQGFPTIKFFRRGTSTTYRGSRSKEAILEFAMKATRPILTMFKTREEFETRRRKSEVFFLFVKDESETSEEYKEILKDVAEMKIAQVMFNSIMSKDLSTDIKLEKVPSLLVFKDNKFSTFEAGSESLNKTSVLNWVDREKFPSFLFVTESNVDELADSGKTIVFAAFAKEIQKGDLNKRLGESIKKLSLELNTRFDKHFQFAGLMEPTIIESIMMSTVELPLVFVLEPKSRVYYILPSSAITKSFGTNELSAFLEDVLSGKSTAYGGRTFSTRMWRLWWEVRSSAQDIWKASPLMALFMFGVPFIVVVFLVAMLCFLDPASEDETCDEDEMGQNGEQEDEKEIEEHVEPETKPPGRLKAE